MYHFIINHQQQFYYKYINLHNFRAIKAAVFISYVCVFFVYGAALVFWFPRILYTIVVDTDRMQHAIAKIIFWPTGERVKMIVKKVTNTTAMIFPNPATTSFSCPVAFFNIPVNVIAKDKKIIGITKIRVSANDHVVKLSEEQPLNDFVSKVSVERS